MKTIASFVMPFFLMWGGVYLLGFVVRALSIFEEVPMGTGY